MADDSLYWSTALVLNFEDSSATTFTDISPNALSTSAVAGNAENSATQFKTGSKSLALDGTGDWVTWADNADFQFGTGDFCVEFWYRPTTGTPGSENWIAMYGRDGSLAAGTDYGWLIRQTTAGKIGALFYTGTTSYVTVGTTTLSSGVWVHVAYVKVSGTVKLYINGVEEDSDTYNTAVNIPAGTPILRIGAATTGVQPTTGYVDGFRITKGYARYTANFASSLPTELFTATAPLTSAIAATMPSPTFESYLGGSITGTLPMPTAAMTFAGNVAAAMPMPQARVTMNTASNVIEATMPMPTVEVRMGARIAATMPTPTVEATGTTTIMVSIEATMPMPTVEAVMSGVGSVRIAATMPMPTVAATTGANISAAMPMPTFSASATTGSVITITAVMPMADVLVDLSTGGVISIAAEMPMLVAGPWGRIAAVMPMAQVSIIAHSVVTVTYEAYAVNLLPGENMPHQVTRYTDYPFNQFIRHGNNWYGVADDGLYLLGGDDDDGTAIAWEFDTAITDFGSSQNKVVRETFVGARLGPTVSASVSIGEAPDVTYAASIVRGSTAQNHRVKYGKGLKARYWRFGFADSAGSELNIDTLEFDARETGGRL